MRFTRLTPYYFSLGAALLLFVSSAAATDSELSKVSSTVAQVFAEGHYSHFPMDGAMAQRHLNLYFDKLDPDHLFFTRQDIDRLTRLHAATFGKQTSEGKLTAALEIYDLYKKRVHERRAKIEQVLKSEHFDFTSNGFVELSREHAPWPKDAVEADKIWRNQIEGDLLDDKLAGKNISLGLQEIRDRYDRIEEEAQNHSHSAVMADLLSALAHAYDPHSEYLRKQDFDDLNTDMRLSMVGIGITIEPDGRFMKITDVFPASPAGVDGRLKPKDRILAVAHGDEGFVRIDGMPFDQVMDLLHARKGTRIQLKVIEPGNPTHPRVVDLVARTIELTDDQAKAEVIERSPRGSSSPSATQSQPARLGWLQIPSFYGDPEHAKGRSVAKDVRQLLRQLNSQHIDGLVLDLRGNPGGELDEAVKIGGLFLGKVPIVQEKDSDGAIYVSKANTPAIYHGPMVVLIDHLTASAAELLAAALQDHHRAIIAGGCYSSFGKGTVQTVVELKELLPNVPKSDAFGAIQLTIAKFYRVNGASTQLRGLVADIPLPSPEDLPGGGEISMKNPLTYDEAPPVMGLSEELTSDNLSTVTAQLKQLSLDRVRNDREFQYLTEDLALAKQNANKVSLNEATRRKELAEEKARTSVRDAERARLAQLEAAREKVVPIALAVEKTSRNASAKNNAKNIVGTSTSQPHPDAVRNEALNILEDFAELSRHSAAQ